MKKEEPALDPLEIVLILLALLAGFLILPAAFWHGTTDSGGWRWDIHSTVSCGIWWGFWLFCAGWGFLAHVNSPAMKARERSARLLPLWGGMVQPDLRRRYGTAALEPEEGLRPPF